MFWRLQVLGQDASNVEAMASLASHHFYTDQAEIALKYCRRLLQVGCQNTELWNNIGLCCFYASQYDMVRRRAHGAALRTRAGTVAAQF